MFQIYSVILWGILRTYNHIVVTFGDYILSLATVPLRLTQIMYTAILFHSNVESELHSLYGCTLVSLSLHLSDIWSFPVCDSY